MKKYKAKVIHNVEIVLDDDSTLNKKDWLEIIASNLAYHKAGEHGRYIGQKVEIEDIHDATEQKKIDEIIFKSKIKSIIKMAQDPTISQERKEEEIFAMISLSMEK